MVRVMVGWSVSSNHVTIAAIRKEEEPRRRVRRSILDTMTSRQSSLREKPQTEAESSIGDDRLSALEESRKKTQSRRRGGRITSERKVALAPLKQQVRSMSGLVEIMSPEKRHQDLELTSRIMRQFIGLIEEFRNADLLRRHGLPIRSKILFCGPPGCGKTATAEAFAKEIGLPLIILKLDSVISSFLGETASNLRKVFETAEGQPSVLFLDKFDALARTRADNGENSEIRRVVNSLLLMVEAFRGRGFLVAATNLEGTLDAAIWRRFDEVIFFDKPKDRQIRQMLRLRTRNFPTSFSVENKATEFRGWSYADIERVCLNAIKRSLLNQKKALAETDFNSAIKDEIQRQMIRRKMGDRVIQKD